MKPQHIVAVVALGIVGAAIAFMSYTNGGVGTVTTTDTGVTRVFSKAKADAEVTMPIALQEGSDVQHESSHIFDVLKGYIGISEATIRPDGSAITVRFASSEIAEDSIRSAYAAAGYLVAQ